MEGGSTFVIVPRGWSREVEKNCVFYTSPDQTTLKSRDELLYYLMSSGTCKCGLICPFQLDVQFSFNSNVISLPDQSEAMSVCKYAHVTHCNDRKGRRVAKGISSLDFDSFGDIKLSFGDMKNPYPGIMTPAFVNRGISVPNETDGGTCSSPTNLSPSSMISSLTKSHLQIFDLLKTMQERITSSPPFKKLANDVPGRLPRYLKENGEADQNNRVLNGTDHGVLNEHRPEYLTSIKGHQVSDTGIKKKSNGTSCALDNELPMDCPSPRKRDYGAFDQNILHDGIFNFDNIPSESDQKSAPFSQDMSPEPSRTLFPTQGECTESDHSSVPSSRDMSPEFHHNLVPDVSLKCRQSLDSSSHELSPESIQNLVIPSRDLNPLSQHMSPESHQNLVTPFPDESNLVPTSPESHQNLVPPFPDGSNLVPTSPESHQNLVPPFPDESNLVPTSPESHQNLVPPFPDKSNLVPRDVSIKSSQPPFRDESALLVPRDVSTESHQNLVSPFRDEDQSLVAPSSRDAPEYIPSLVPSLGDVSLESSLVLPSSRDMSPEYIPSLVSLPPLRDLPLNPSQNWAVPDASSEPTCNLVPETPPAECGVPFSRAAAEYKLAGLNINTDKIHFSASESSSPKSVTSRKPISDSLEHETTSGSEVEVKLGIVQPKNESCISGNQQRVNSSGSVIPPQNSDSASKIAKDISLKVKDFHISLRDCSLSPQRGYEKEKCSSPQKSESHSCCVISLKKHPLSALRIPKKSGEKLAVLSDVGLCSNTDGVKNTVQGNSRVLVKAQDLNVLTHNGLAVSSDAGASVDHDDHPIFEPPREELSKSDKHPEILPKSLSFEISQEATDWNQDKHPVQSLKVEPTQKGCGLILESKYDDDLKSQNRNYHTQGYSTDDPQNSSSSVPTPPHNKVVDGNSTPFNPPDDDPELTQDDDDMDLTPVNPDVTSEDDMDLTLVDTDVTLDDNSAVDLSITADVNSVDMAPNDDPDVTPNDDSLTPVNSDATPNDDSLTPVNSDATPNDDSLTPVNSDATPNDDYLTPVNSDATPNDDSLTPVNPDATPNDDYLTPVNSDATPNDDSLTPVNPDVTPNDYSLTLINPDVTLNDDSLTSVNPDVTPGNDMDSTTPDDSSVDVNLPPVNLNLASFEDTSAHSFHEKLTASHTTTREDGRVCETKLVGTESSDSSGALTGKLSPSAGYLSYSKSLSKSLSKFTNRSTLSVSTISEAPCQLKNESTTVSVSTYKPFSISVSKLPYHLSKPMNESITSLSSRADSEPTIAKTVGKSSKHSIREGSHPPTFFSCDRLEALSTRGSSTSRHRSTPAGSLSLHQFDILLIFQAKEERNMLGEGDEQKDHAEDIEMEESGVIGEQVCSKSSTSSHIRGSGSSEDVTTESEKNVICLSGKKRPASLRKKAKTATKKRKTDNDSVGREFDGSPYSTYSKKYTNLMHLPKEYPIRSRKISVSNTSQEMKVSSPDIPHKQRDQKLVGTSEITGSTKKKRGRPSHSSTNNAKKLVSETETSGSSITIDGVPDPEISLAMEQLFGDENELELTVSIPFRIGKKRLANHTLLVCTGSEISVEKDSNFKVGDVIWAKAAMLPAWPGKIISYKDKDLKKPPNDKAWIEWYGESTVSLVRKSYIKTLKEGVGKRLKLKPLTEDLKNAINLAIIEATKQKESKKS